jgi:hypothetical protein
VATIKPGFAEPPGDSKANALQHLIPATCQPSETAFRANAHQRRSWRHGAPVHMIKLTETGEITPYLWVHPVAGKGALSDADRAGCTKYRPR